MEWNVTDESINAIAANCTLAHLNVGVCEDLTDDAIKAVANCVAQRLGLQKLYRRQAIPRLEAIDYWKDEKETIAWALEPIDDDDVPA